MSFRSRLLNILPSSTTCGVTRLGSMVADRARRSEPTSPFLIAAASDRAFMALS